VREQTVAELYRDCKVHCEGANRHLVSCVKYRQIVNCGFNLQFFKTKKSGKLKKHQWRRKRGGKKSNFIPIMKKKFKQKNRNDKPTLYDLHHVACFDLQAALRTATADILNFSYKSKHFT
jgi:hypothetical protein